MKKFYHTHECYGVAADKYSDVFFSEFSKSTITKVDVGETISIVADSMHKIGFSGDGGLVTNAKLNGKLLYKNIQLFNSVGN